MDVEGLFLDAVRVGRQLMFVWTKILLFILKNPLDLTFRLRRQPRSLYTAKDSQTYAGYRARRVISLPPNSFSGFVVWVQCNSFLRTCHVHIVKHFKLVFSLG